MATKKTARGGSGRLQQRPRGDERRQHVLVDRQFVLALVEVPEAPAEPVRERGVDAGDGLADPTPGEGRPSAPGVVRDHQREAFVGGAGPQRRLAEARVNVFLAVQWLVVVELAQRCVGA